jgi:hypothetical protein
VRPRRLTCVHEAKGSNTVHCAKRGGALPIEERARPNNCPDYERMGNDLSTPPYPLRERRREQGPSGGGQC